MKTFKKILSALLIIFMLLSAFAVSAEIDSQCVTDTNEEEIHEMISLDFANSSGILRRLRNEENALNSIIVEKVDGSKTEFVFSEDISKTAFQAL